MVVGKLCCVAGGGWIGHWIVRYFNSVADVDVRIKDFNIDRIQPFLCALVTVSI